MKTDLAEELQNTPCISPFTALLIGFCAGMITGILLAPFKGGVSLFSSNTIETRGNKASMFSNNTIDSHENEA